MVDTHGAEIALVCLALVSIKLDNPIWASLDTSTAAAQTSLLFLMRHLFREALLYLFETLQPLLGSETQHNSSPGWVILFFLHLSYCHSLLLSPSSQLEASQVSVYRNRCLFTIRYNLDDCACASDGIAANKNVGSITYGLED